MPPSGQENTSAPLSVVNTTIVLLSSPMSFKCCITAPTLSSSCAIPASSVYQPFSGVSMAWYFGDRNVKTCIRVGFIQTKNGLLACFARSMKWMVESRMTSSKVSMLYLMPAIGCGGSGPSSTMRYLPTLPQRGCTVGSSVSVAHEWIRLRGPTRSLRASGYECQNGSNIASKW